VNDSDTDTPADDEDDRDAPQLTDSERLRIALQDELHVHVRLEDQDVAPDPDARRRLAQRLPDLKAFGDHRYDSVRVLLDWDHQIPSQHLILRVHACYDAEATERFDQELAEREAVIDDANLYPEFDVPDFADLPANESYVAVIRPGSTDIEDFRFLSVWRKEVETRVADRAISLVRTDPGYRRTVTSRTTQGLGGPVVIGWTPPCLAHAESWAIEIWLLTEFDGQTGTARVFMIDLDAEKVTREFNTEVQLA